MSDKMRLRFHEEMDCYLLTVTLPPSESPNTRIAIDVELSDEEAEELFEDMKEAMT